jgi:hypothetical protein
VLLALITQEARTQNHCASDESGSFYLVFYADADLDADSRDTGQPLCLHCLANDSDVQLAAGLDMAKVQAGKKARGVAPSANDEQRDGRRPDEGEDGKRHEQPAQVVVSATVLLVTQAVSCTCGDSAVTRRTLG